MSTKFSAADCALLDEAALATWLATHSSWQRQGDVITRDFGFANHYEVVAFVNALAWVSHRFDHHPDITLGYNQCRVAYSSHDVKGLSRRDLLCAEQADHLFTL